MPLHRGFFVVLSFLKYYNNPILKLFLFKGVNMNNQDFNVFKNEIHTLLKQKTYSLEKEINSLPFIAHIDTLTSNIRDMFFLPIFVAFCASIPFYLDFISLNDFILLVSFWFFIKLFCAGFLFFKLIPIVNNLKHLIFLDFKKPISNYDHSTIYIFSFKNVYEIIKKNKDDLTKEQITILENMILNEKVNIFSDYEKTYLDFNSLSFFNDDKKHIDNLKKSILDKTSFLPTGFFIKQK